MAAHALPGRLPADSVRVARLARRLWITAGGLVVFTLLLYTVWGAGPTLLELTWFNALALTFQGLTCVAVGYLAFGRFRVLRDPASYWVGVAFCVYGTAMVLYVLVWPGLLPGGGSFLAHRSDTAAWFTVFALFGLWLFLQIAAWTERTGATRVPVASWAVTAILSVTLTVGAGALMIGFEAHLPVLVRQGTFTPLLDGIYLLQLALLLSGAWLAARQSKRSGDPLLVLAGFLELALAFVLIWAIAGAGRYSLWWYLGRVAVTAGALVVLFGLLGEYVSLLRREQQKSRDLVAQSAELEATKARLLTNYAELQQANHQLQQEDRRKNEFLAMLSHELRNPLATLSSVLQVWDRAAAGAPGAGGIDALRRSAMRQAEHMARLLDDLLDVSRITGGRISLDMERVALASVVEAAIDSVNPPLLAKRHRLALDLRSDVEVLGDPLRLTQAVANLLDNAIKYTPDEGSIRVAVEQQNGQALVRVSDDGVGIAPERHDDIFELFVQADSSLDRAGSGLGIGLSLTRTLVEMHDGRVDVRSDGPGRGSEFVVRLPVAATRLYPAAAAARSTDVGPQRRVLLVEDNADAAASMAALLGVIGHQAVIAGSGEQALRAVADFTPDVVVLDLGLPGLTGYETAERLRGTPGLESVTLVALTGYGRDEDHQRSRAAGFDHHLIKPVDVETLRRVLSGAATTGRPVR